jgi:serine/threonine protein kinase
VDEYEVAGLLGRGGMGEVHVARTSAGRFVAIKRVHDSLISNRAVCDRLADEARLLRLIDHPNVVSALDSGIDDDGRPFLVMTRAYGTPLDVSIVMDAPMSRERITSIASQLLDGIIAIHDAGVIHADLKSANVMVDEIDRVTIIDFGLARAATTTPAPAAQFDGTPAYLAPEVMAGHGNSIASDIFATAVILYEMLTGTTPLSCHLAAEVLFALRLNEPVEPPSVRAPSRAITAALDDILVRALDRNPHARFSSMRAFAHAFAEALAAWDPPPVTAAEPARPDIDQPTLVRASVAEGIIAESLRAASALIAERDVAGAITVLDAALDRLGSTQPRGTPAMAWRIETVLAALLHSLGKRDRAQRLARLAYQHAVKADCPIARARTTAVLEQLSYGRSRTARGSAAPDDDHSEPHRSTPNSTP